MKERWPTLWFDCYITCIIIYLYNILSLRMLNDDIMKCARIDCKWTHDIIKYVQGSHWLSKFQWDHYQLQHLKHLVLKSTSNPIDEHKPKTTFQGKSQCKLNCAELRCHVTIPTLQTQPRLSQGTRHLKYFDIRKYALQFTETSVMCVLYMTV